MSTPTLQDLRKAKYKTIKQFSIAYGCSASKASMILQGRYQRTLSKDEVVQLAALFEVSFDTCIKACDASYAEWKEKNGWKGSEYEKNSDNLKIRWEWEERIQKEAEEAVKTENWSFFIFARFSFNYQDEAGKHWNSTGSTHDDASGSTHWHTHITPVSSCYAFLGVSQDASEAQIMKAFRQKAKDAHDGKGGYTMDMDKLTQAKEQALARLKARV